MNPVPIPDGAAERFGGRRVVIGDPGDPTGAVRPCEYILTASPNYPGRPCLQALVRLDDDERAAVAAGAHIWLTLDGGELPWRLDIAGRDVSAT